ncbi:MAG: N-acetyltransferase family protein [Nitriliruptoraceae bacterium]
MNPTSIRDATAADLPAVAAIYTHYVLRTTTTFNTEVRTPAEWISRFVEGQDQPGHHFLVAVDNSNVVGFIETRQFRAKQAYARSVELSVYVAPDTHGHGYGQALMDALIHRLTDDPDIHRLYAVIALPNDLSVALHERAGFVHRGTLTEAGFKFGRYLDVAYYERAV